MADKNTEELEQEIAQLPEYEWLRTPTLWYTTHDIAKGLGFSPNTVRKLCESGAIPGARFYGSDMGWKIPRSGILEYLRTSSSGAGHQAG